MSIMTNNIDGITTNIILNIYKSEKSDKFNI